MTDKPECPCWRCYCEKRMKESRTIVAEPLLGICDGQDSANGRVSAPSDLAPEIRAMPVDVKQAQGAAGREWWIKSNNLDDWILKSEPFGTHSSEFIHVVEKSAYNGLLEKWNETLIERNELKADLEASERYNKHWGYKLGVVIAERDEWKQRQMYSMKVRCDQAEQIKELRAERDKFLEVLEKIAEDYVGVNSHNDCPGCFYDGRLEIIHDEDCVYLVAHKVLGLKL